MWIVEQLENAVDIIDLVNRYAKLKKAGANYKALCPFPGHSEKTPSFVVSPSKQLAYCFWCHRWGWALKFIMDIENCEFREAIEILGNLTWIETWNVKVEDTKKLRSIYSLFKDINSFYVSRLEKYPEMQKYLYDRGMTSEDIKKFWFGFADSGVELYNFLKKKEYDDDLISESNVFLDLKTKKDKFINRIIFPLQNQRGDIVWFAWRVVWAWNPKYLNSPASKVYDKSSILYGLYQAKKSITEKDYIIITEGYMDAISLHKAWFENAVAVSGTALTEKHVPIMKRLTKRIYLCFDNDWAWEKATKSSIELLKNRELEVKVIDMDSFWKDPDEVITSGKNFQELIDSALTPIWFYLKNVEEKYDLTSLNEKQKLANELLNILKSYSDIIERDYYLKEISKKLDISLNVLYDLFSKMSQTKVKKVTQETTLKVSAVDLAIWMILVSPELSKKFKDWLIFYDIMPKNFKGIVESWKNYFSSLDLDSQSKYSALEMKAWEEKEMQDIQTWNSRVDKLIFRINEVLFKKMLQKITSEMAKTPWDLELLSKYQELIKKGNKYGLK